ncbi:MAG TPA: hypothetical protein VGE67_02310, partial [Haloferula sp.]
MKRLRRVLRVLAVLLLVLFAAAFAATGWWGSGHLVSPARRPLQDYHRQILDRPEAYGLRVEPFTAADRTPCLLV